MYPFVSLVSYDLHGVRAGLTIWWTSVRVLPLLSYTRRGKISIDCPQPRVILILITQVHDSAPTNLHPFGGSTPHHVSQRREKGRANIINGMEKKYSCLLCLVLWYYMYVHIYQVYTVARTHKQEKKRERERKEKENRGTWKKGEKSEKQAREGKGNVTWWVSALLLLLLLFLCSIWKGTDRHYVCMYE